MIGAKRPHLKVVRRTVRSGFSLLEMLIVIALFSTLTVIVSQTFISFSTLHRRTANTAVVGAEMRFAMEYMVRAARNRELNYVSGPLDPQDTVLHLRDTSGATLDIGPRPGGTSGDCKDATVAQCLAVSVDGGATWQPLTGKRVEVTNFRVYPRPVDSPFVAVSGAYPSNTQPFVTVTVGLRYMSERVQEQASLEAQTTVSSRMYAR